jgi:uncharacterized protein
MSKVSTTFNEQHWREHVFSAAAGNDAAAITTTAANFPQALQWKDGDGLTALMHAAKAGAKDVVAVLIAAGATVDATNHKGSTALLFAAAAGKAVIADLLLKAGANVDHANANGHTALIIAASDGYKNTLSLLLDNGANALLKDAEGNTARAYALEYGHTEAAETLARAEEKQQAPAPATVATTVQVADAPLNLPPLSQDANSKAIKSLEQRLIRAGLTCWTRSPAKS